MAVTIPFGMPCNKNPVNLQFLLFFSQNIKTFIKFKNDVETIDAISEC